MRVEFNVVNPGGSKLHSLEWRIQPTILPERRASRSVRRANCWTSRNCVSIIFALGAQKVRERGTRFIELNVVAEHEVLLKQRNAVWDESSRLCEV